MDMDTKIVLWWIAEVMTIAALVIGIVLMTVKLIDGFGALEIADVVGALLTDAVMAWMIDFVHDVCEFKLDELEAKLGTR